MPKLPCLDVRELVDRVLPDTECETHKIIDELVDIEHVSSPISMYQRVTEFPARAVSC